MISGRRNVCTVSFDASTIDLQAHAVRHVKLDVFASGICTSVMGDCKSRRLDDQIDVRIPSA